MEATKTNMPEWENRLSSESSDDYICTPVVPLKEELKVKDLVDQNQIEFEVMPELDDDELYDGATSAESMLNFESIQRFINLNVTDVDEIDGEDGSPFDKYRRKMKPITEDGKVMKYIEKEGTGPVVPDNATVYIRYQGYFEYQEVPFDSTILQNENKRDDPRSFSLAKRQLIVGLQEAILTMRKGEKAEILIHPDLAFGKMGCPPRIPEDAYVLFVVELDRYVDCGEALIDDDDLDMEDRFQFKHVIKKAKALHLLGGDKFKNEKIAEASASYRKAINMLHNSRLADEEEEKQRNHLLIKLYSNLCICYHKQKNYKRVCCMAADALRTNSKEARQNFKIFYYWGYAKMMLGDYEGAQAHLSSAKKLAPHDAEITKALSMLAKKKIESRQAEKLMYQRAFNFKPSPKITEIKEVADETRNTIWDQLKIFRENPDQDSMYLRDQVSPEDERIWIEVANELGLYARVVSGEKRTIHIRKPN